MTYIASLDRTIAPSAYAEAASEFNAEVPEWERRLAEHDGEIVPENEMSIPADRFPATGFHTATPEEWDWFFSSLR